MSPALKTKLIKAFEKDPDILCRKAEVQETLGSDARYLDEVLGLNKSDLIRLERLGLSFKARYETKAGHRIRWVIYKEALE